jgi:hypothetical protein
MESFLTEVGVVIVTWFVISLIYGLLRAGHFYVRTWGGGEVTINLWDILLFFPTFIVAAWVYILWKKISGNVVFSFKID